MAHLPDGEYILTCDVLSPLPARLHSRRRGWMRAAKWHINTHFHVENGQLSADICRGSANLTPSQQRKVGVALLPHLKPWVATLPSELVPYGDCDDALDALYALGKITMDDVRLAQQMRKVIGAIGDGLTAISESEDEPPTATAPSAPGPVLREGDVILDSEGSPSQRYVVVRLVSPGMYEWQCETGDEAFEQRWANYREPHVGHVADMLASGLIALDARLGVAPAAPTVILGYDTAGTPVREGDVLGVDSDPSLRLLVTGLAIVKPSAGPGPHVTYRALRGNAGVGLDTISLCKNNKWRLVAIATTFEQHQAPTPPAARTPHRDSNLDPFSLD